jgi:hypothetical protein
MAARETDAMKQQRFENSAADFCERNALVITYCPARASAETARNDANQFFASDPMLYSALLSPIAIVNLSSDSV